MGRWTSNADDAVRERWCERDTERGKDEDRRRQRDGKEKGEEGVGESRAGAGMPGSIGSWCWAGDSIWGEAASRAWGLLARAVWRAM